METLINSGYKLTIAKHFDKLKKAESHHNRLLEKYDYVRLIKYPMFNEAGTYIWEIK